jgi:phospholipid transport system substrate-binding protein
MSIKNIFSSLVFLIIIFSNVTKVHSIEADVFVQSTVNRAAKTLGGNLTKEERIKKLKDIARETVDIEGIGFYSLGANRKNLSSDQLNEYKKVFSEYFLKSFASRLAEYSNPEIEVNSKKIINKNYTIVSSTLVATESRPEVQIQWRVYTKDPDNLLIRDLIIEGLSLARTQKEEFSSIINSNDGKIEALLKNLSDFAAK